MKTATVTSTYYANSFRVDPPKIPEGVEDLTIDFTKEVNIDIPDTVRRLTLGSRFDGSIRTFPSQLEEIHIHNYVWPMGDVWVNGPNYLDNLPETVRVIEIGWMVPVAIRRFPRDLKEFSIAKPDYTLASLWGESHAEVPEGVKVTFTEGPDDYYTQ